MITSTPSSLTDAPIPPLHFDFPSTLTLPYAWHFPHIWTPRTTDLLNFYRVLRIVPYLRYFTVRYSTLLYVTLPKPYRTKPSVHLADHPNSTSHFPPPRHQNPVSQFSSPSSFAVVVVVADRTGCSTHSVLHFHFLNSISAVRCPLSAVATVALGLACVTHICGRD